MPRTPKTRPGGKVLRLDAVADCYVEGRWLYYRHKPYHPSFIANWPLASVLRAMNEGRLRYAVSTETNLPYRSPQDPPF